jgi:hypothetical protein
MDSFDHYVAADFLKKWTSGSVNIVAGRNGNGGRTDGRVTIDYQMKWTHGAAFKVTLNSDLLRMYNNGAGPAVYAKVRSDGLVAGYVYDTNLGTGGAHWDLVGLSSVVLHDDQWNFIEQQATFSTYSHGGSFDWGAGDYLATNSLKIWINGSLEISWSGTKMGGITVVTGLTEGCDQLGPSTSNLTHIVDDYYINDGNGSYMTDNVGDMLIEVIRPDGTGDTTTWTASYGTSTDTLNWQQADDINPDGDTSFIFSTSTGDIDVYNFEDVGTGLGDILAIQHNLITRKSGPGTRAVQLVMRMLGTDGTGTNYLSAVDNYLNESYIDYRMNYDYNPYTTATFVESDLNNGQWGEDMTV